MFNTFVYIDLQACRLSIIFWEQMCGGKWAKSHQDRNRGELTPPQTIKFLTTNLTVTPQLSFSQHCRTKMNRGKNHVLPGEYPVVITDFWVAPFVLWFGSSVVRHPRRYTIAVFCTSLCHWESPLPVPHLPHTICACSLFLDGLES